MCDQRQTLHSRDPDMLSWHAQVLAQAKTVQYDYSGRLAGLHAAAKATEGDPPPDRPIRPVARTNGSAPAGGSGDASDRQMARARSEVEYYKKLASAAQGDVAFWESAVGDREALVAQLRQELKEAHAAREAMVLEKAKNGPSRLEAIQADAIGQKEDQIRRLQEDALHSEQRVAKAERELAETRQQLATHQTDEANRAAGAAESVASLTGKLNDATARIGSLERQLAKRSEAVKQLEERLVGWEPELAKKVAMLTSDLEASELKLGSVTQLENEIADLRRRGHSYEHEIAQLQKQRSHLEQRLAEQAIQIAARPGPQREERGEPEEPADEDDEEQTGEGVSMYSDLLQEAFNTQLSYIERLRLVGVTAKDVDGAPVVVLAPGNVPSQVDPRHLMLFLIRYFEDLEIFHSLYCVVYCDSSNGAQPEHNLLLEMLRALPPRARGNLKRAVVLHPAVGASSLANAIRELYGESKASRLQLLDDSSELANDMWQRRIVLPDYVYAAEADGEGSELVVKSRRLLWNDTIDKQQRKRQLSLLQRDKESLDYFRARLAQLLAEKRFEEAQFAEEDIAALESEVAELEWAINQTNPN